MTLKHISFSKGFEQVNKNKQANSPQCFPVRIKEGFDFIIPTIKIEAHITHGYTLSVLKLGKLVPFDTYSPYAQNPKGK